MILITCAYIYRRKVASYDEMKNNNDKIDECVYEEIELRNGKLIFKNFTTWLTSYLNFVVNFCLDVEYDHLDHSQSIPDGDGLVANSSNTIVCDEKSSNQFNEEVKIQKTSSDAFVMHPYGVNGLKNIGLFLPSSTEGLYCDINSLMKTVLK